MRLVNVPLADNSGIALSLDQTPQERTDYPSQDTNLELLLRLYPGKILFSMQATADILNVSYEFIRTKVLSGEISAASFGARKLIHITELARLTTKGIPS